MKKIKNRYHVIVIILLIIYIYFILSKTLLYRQPFEGNHIILDLFWSYKIFNKQWIQILENIILFIPFGILLSALVKHKWIVIITGFIFSCLIEISQYIFKIGLFELDDIFHNSLGLVIGIIIYYLLIKFYYFIP